VLKQITIVAGDLEYLTFPTKVKSVGDHFAVLTRMLDPRRRIRGKIRIFCKNMLWLDVFLQLDQEAPVADEHVQWKVGLHLVNLVGS